MLGCNGTKGTLACDADADIVVLNDQVDANGEAMLIIEEVWKFGKKVYDISESG
jgi:N-acetylglucosamine-6-phosphate deacetylase